MKKPDGLEVYKRPLARRNQRWRWRLIVNGHNLAVSSEGYANRVECERMAQRVVGGTYAHLLPT